MRLLVPTMLHLSLLIAVPTFAADPAPEATAAPAEKKKEEPTPTPTPEAKAVVCDPHGVKKALCTRCDAKLEPIFKKKGDWCSEHNRPESQCVICNPELAKKGVK